MLANLKKFTKIKTRSFVLLLALIGITSALVWFFNFQTSHLRSLVSETQHHIQSINSKLQVLDNDNNENNLEVDSTYLELLGFVKEPTLFKENIKVNDLNSKNENNHFNQDESKIDILDNNNVNTNAPRIPPLVTAFQRFTEKEKALIESKLRYFQNDLFIIYDLDLSSSEQLKIKKLCNSSCSLKMFKADKYPRHLVESKMKAYKPIIIQEVLNAYGAIIWIEPPNVFVSGDVQKYLNKTKQNGILAWPNSEPVSQLTHPSMFKYFKTQATDFYFVHILDTTQFIIYNNQLIHNNLMLPWVKCALKEECISPRGSKYYGCDFTRRPRFLYSGCHRYEKSAFSILTSLLFDFNQSKYTMWYENSPTRLANETSTYGELLADESIDEMDSFINKYYESSFMTIVTATTRTSEIKPAVSKDTN